MRYVVVATEGGLVLHVACVCNQLLLCALRVACFMMEYCSHQPGHFQPGEPGSADASAPGPCPALRLC